MRERERSASLTPRRGWLERETVWKAVKRSMGVRETALVPRQTPKRTSPSHGACSPQLTSVVPALASTLDIVGFLVAPPPVGRVTVAELHGEHGTDSAIRTAYMNTGEPALGGMPPSQPSAMPLPSPFPALTQPCPSPLPCPCPALSRRFPGPLTCPFVPFPVCVPADSDVEWRPGRPGGRCNIPQASARTRMYPDPSRRLSPSLALGTAHPARSPTGPRPRPFPAPAGCTHARAGAADGGAARPRCGQGPARLRGRGSLPAGARARPQPARMGALRSARVRPLL